MVIVYLAERSPGPEKTNDMMEVQELILVRTRVKKEMAEP